MRVAHYVPNDFMALFGKHLPDIQFLHNDCDSSTDLIYCGSVSCIAAALKAKRKYGLPLACWVWDITHNWRDWTRNDEEVVANLHRDKKVASYIAQLKKCDMVVSASYYTKKILKDIYGVKSRRLYFYIDTEGLDAVPEQPKENRIIQISRYALNKRFDMTIEATEGLDAELVCVGLGTECHESLSRFAASENPSAKLMLDIPREETIRLLKSSKVLVSPSVFEGWGITPLEALYCGVPVVLSDLAVFKEMHGDRVLYHEQDNVEDMRRQVERLLANETIGQRMVADSQEMLEGVKPQRFAMEWKALMEELL